METGVFLALSNRKENCEMSKVATDQEQILQGTSNLSCGCRHRISFDVSINDDESEREMIKIMKIADRISDFNISGELKVQMN